MRRIVVTGLGLLTPVGVNVTSSWKNLIAGHSGIKKIPDFLFKSDDLACKIAGIIIDIEQADYFPGADEFFDVHKYISSKDARTMDRFIHFACVAAQEALEDAKWSEDDKLRTGVLIGSGIGGLRSIEKHCTVLNEKGPRQVSPFFIPASLINLAAGHVSMRHNILGPNSSVVSACATGANAIGEAARIIQSGNADVMVCGGAEAAICRLGIAGFAAARALSTKYNEKPKAASRPWDKGRDGFVMGEGAGIVVLEELEHAISRGVRIYAELIGYGITGDAYHITAPEPDGTGGLRAMQIALNQAQITTDEVDYINAHGTSTPLGDMIEFNAVQRLFKPEKRRNELIMSSTKSAIGHTLGAAGSIEAIFSILAMRDRIIPPTLNLDDPEPVSGINLVPHRAVQADAKVVMSNSFGFGGVNTCLIFRNDI